MKQVDINELYNIIQSYPNYSFTIDKEPEDVYYSIWEDILEDLVEWNCGVYDYCLQTYIHVYNEEDNYMGTYKIQPAEELKQMCDNWDK